MLRWSRVAARAASGNARYVLRISRVPAQSADGLRRLDEDAGQHGEEEDDDELGGTERVRAERLVQRSTSTRGATMAAGP